MNCVQSASQYFVSGLASQSTASDKGLKSVFNMTVNPASITPSWGAPVPPLGTGSNHTPRMQAPITPSRRAPITPLGCRLWDVQPHPQDAGSNHILGRGSIHTPRMQAPITSHGDAPHSHQSHTLGTGPNHGHRHRRQSHPIKALPSAQASHTTTEQNLTVDRAKPKAQTSIHGAGLRPRRRPKSLGPGYAQGADLGTGYAPIADHNYSPWGWGYAQGKGPNHTPENEAKPKAQASITPQKRRLSPRLRPQSHPRGWG